MMKQFLIRVAAVGFLAIAVFFVLVLIISVSFHNNKDSFMMAFFAKQKMLADKHAAKTPAVVLLGGSNVAFGFNSKILSDSLKIPVINAGLYRGLGLKLMFDNTAKFLDAGDILAISPEYGHFFGNAAYGEMVDIFYIKPSLAKDFNLKQVEVIIFRTKNLLREWILTTMKLKTEPAFTYKASHFNEYGDYAAHWSMPSRPFSHASVKDFKDVNTDFLDYCENKIISLQKQGVKVIIIPPPFPETSYGIVKTQLATLLQEFDKHNINFAVPIQEYVFPDSLFFDTHYHLGYDGILIRTNKVIRDIRPFLSEE